MMNNKGMTLVEIVISIGLVSIIMVFTLNLLVELRSEEALGSNKSNDLLNRSIIIRTVQNDFLNKEIEAIAETNKIAGRDDYKGCGLADSVNGFDSTYTIYSCLRIKYVGETDDYFLAVGAKDVTDTNKTSDDVESVYFIYGKNKAGGYEAWKLNSGVYKKFSNCYEFQGFTSGNNEANYVRVYFPVEVSEANENTMMNFDLEFLIYLNDTTFATQAKKTIADHGCIIKK